MLKTIDSIAKGWFNCPLLELPREKKARLLPYVYRSYRTSIPQLARCFGLGQDIVARLLGKACPGIGAGIGKGEA